MHVYHSPASASHDPKTFYRRGNTIPHPENAERYRILRNAIAESGMTLHEAGDAGIEPLRVVHPAEYLQFLAEAWERRAEIDSRLQELLTTQFARPQMQRKPGSLLGQLGYYTADTSTPIRAGTWDAVYGSAQCALSAADAAAKNGYAYALCRPPGHHAFAASAGGFCYVNNTAVAAQRLAATLRGRIAIVDVDVHHGNGTQGIFYQRADVLTVSLHADPTSYFPFYCGYADEIGEGEGRGFNINMPLAHGTGDAEFHTALGQALDHVVKFAPVALVVALGLDASEHDPLGVLKVTTAGFAGVAGMIAKLGLPTVIVQEGGYVCPALPVNLVTFLQQFEKSWRLR